MKSQREKAPTKPTKPKTPKQEKIIEIKQAHPDLTTREIAAVAETDHSYVVQVLQRYNIEQKSLEEYKKNRADIFAGFQDRILKSITDEDLKKAPFGSRILAMAQIYDKERLERGQSTDNVNLLVAGLKDLQAIRWGKTVDKPVGNNNSNDNQ